MPEITPPGNPTHNRRKDDRPGEILEAALKEFSIYGFAGTRLDDVAAHAGICKGTIYLYFKSKEELFEAVVRERTLPTIEQMEQVQNESTGSAAEILRQQLTIIYREYVSTDTRHISKLIISEGNRFPKLAEFYYREIIKRCHKLILSVIKRGVDNGEFRPEALHWNPQAIFSPALTAALWRDSFDAFEPLDEENMLNTHIDLLLNGLKVSSHK